MIFGEENEEIIVGRFLYVDLIYNDLFIEYWVIFLF